MAISAVQEREDTNKEVDRFIDELERLRLSYEQYFLGLEKREPSKRRESVLNVLRKYSGSAIQNARTRFKFQQAVARYNTYATYWDRILKEIEEGTYKRDVFKAKLHEKERGIIQAKPKKSEDPVTLLFAEYMNARKKCNENTANMSLEGFKKTIQSQLDLIYKKTGSKDVRFQVTMENGKTKIKAVAKTSTR